MARTDRRHSNDLAEASGRTSGQKDYDRILYSSAFRRLANITQVVAADQGALLHNRLTHTLKVAQLGRRLAEKLIRENDPTKIERLGGLDPDVVEAACLAHDLGHPPFGHIAEDELNRLAEAAGARGGFEGNAQSFRIVTKLAIRKPDRPGLDLSRGTLNALLKYPWERNTVQPEKSMKWGAYHSESEELSWVRQDDPPGEERRTLEAEVMDFADDIAYSIYDVEDFYRANKIPMHDLFVEDPDTTDNLSAEASKFFTEVFSRWKPKGEKITAQGQREYKAAFLNMVSALPRLEQVFNNTHLQRSLLRDWTSVLVGRYIRAFELEELTERPVRRTRIKPTEQKELAILKQVIWHYVITNNGLASQQYGYRKVIEKLFEALLDSAEKHGGYMLPLPVREALDKARLEAENLPPGHETEPIVRVVVDYIASMTEQEALALYRRLQGISFGSFQNMAG